MQFDGSYVVHIRSVATRHWTGIGTPMCNDSAQLPTDIRHDPAGPVCRRCKAAYFKE
jgi:hypothetical protein